MFFFLTKNGTNYDVIILKMASTPSPSLKNPECTNMQIILISKSFQTFNRWMQDVSFTVKSALCMCSLKSVWHSNQDIK